MCHYLVQYQIIPAPSSGHDKTEAEIVPLSGALKIVIFKS